jgi:hypothetical protein
MKKIACILLLAAIAATSAFAQLTATGRAPQVTGLTGGAAVDAEFNSLLNGAFDDLLNDLNKQLREVAFGNPSNFVKAMGNASAFGSHGATNRHYAGYKIFSASLGFMAGIQLPEELGAFIEHAGDLGNRLTEDGDINLGLNPQFFNAQVGFNTSFLVKNLYLGLRLGFFNLPSSEAIPLSCKTFTLGVLANYQFIPKLSLAKVIEWRGLNFGSGIIYHNSQASLAGVSIGDAIPPITVSGDTTISMDPTASFNFKINTVTVPLEAMTAIKLVFLNIPLGLGVDMVFGSSDLRFGVDSDINLDGLPAGATQSSKGSISVSGGAKEAPSFFNLKLMTGLGLCFGPVYLDIPFTYYFITQGYNLGITLGVSF